MKLTAGKANVYLYVKTGNSWLWHDGGAVLVDSSLPEFTTVAIDLTKVKDIQLIKAIGIKIEPIAGDNGTVQFYVDDIALQ
ncbi:Mannan endo-1,4-beta-mannosidase A and B precursor [compost metagenome]